MNIPKTWVVLLALLVAAMAMVPMVSANALSATDSEKISELNAASLNQSNTQLPRLQYLQTQKKAIINGEFRMSDSTQSSQVAMRVTESAVPIVTNLPFGAIVEHSNNGVTTVFDSDGIQLFAVDDATAPLINIVGGALPATFVFEVPDQSLIVDKGDITHVFFNNNRIVSIVGKSGGVHEFVSSSLQTCSPQTLSPQWIEYGETARISTVGQFSARWNVPKEPVLVSPYTPGISIDGSQSTVWNGLEDTNGTYLLQPVLEWYVRSKASDPYPTEANWSIASWWISPKENNGNGIHSTRRYGIPSTGELVESGDLIQGNLYHSGAIWSGAITDLTLGISSTLFLNSSQSSDLTYRNLQAYTVLEGWNTVALNPQSYNSSYLPGNTTFTNIIINDIYGNSVIPASMPGYVNTANWSPTAYGLSVTNSSWPASISLNTGNN
ncbi:hypothetical protein [Methanoregula formicica]|uniref:Uncharacterized protein n=1 Tax=Methanoregula formicica (strain DSM 22288 / NBRC 105244 / SMSP) TaxID=593750 RepID=L0HI06_METFS|nr:hypothetical protein [Methanoregula formicica]AGB02958.1 hypothetical protein Metfor_1940 [Methanoregula formicica SMSP]